MSFGIEIKNNEGGTQLDASFDSVRLFDEGSLITSSQEDGGAPGAYSVNHFFPEALPRDEPFIFCIQPKDKWVGFTSLSGGQDANGNLYTDGINIFSDAANTFNYRMFVRYDYGNPPTPGSHGLQIFNASGETVYDSRIPEGLFLDTVIIPAYDSYSGAPAPVSHALRSYAYYSLNLFPAGINTYDYTRELSQWVYKAFRQSSAGSLELGFVSAIAAKVNVQTPAYGSTIMVLDDSNF